MSLFLSSSTSIPRSKMTDQTSIASVSISRIFHLHNIIFSSCFAWPGLAWPGHKINQPNQPIHQIEIKIKNPRTEFCKSTRTLACPHPDYSVITHEASTHDSLMEGGHKQIKKNRAYIPAYHSLPFLITHFFFFFFLSFSLQFGSRLIPYISSYVTLRFLLGISIARWF